MRFTENSIKAEILANGPMETGFAVYQDFMNYKEGIYQHTTGSFLGNHAVKVTGWGEENGLKYWIAQNSWTKQWGEQGTFKVKVGDVGFASTANACNPALPNARNKFVEAMN